MVFFKRQLIYFIVLIGLFMMTSAAAFKIELNPNGPLHILSSVSTVDGAIGTLD